MHFGKRTDDHANQVFIVNGADRKKISDRDNARHAVERRLAPAADRTRRARGETEVYFDDMKNSAMEAVDKTFTSGQVGFGSFDDLGNFDNFILRGAVVEPGKR